MMLKIMIRPGSTISSVNGSTNFVDGKYYHFYDRMQTDKPPGYYKKLLSEAEETIVIWDPHYSQCRGELFSVIDKNGIYIEILTICNNGDTKEDIEGFGNMILDAIDDADVPNCQVKIFALMPRHLRSWRCPGTEWHDRFLIIDNNKVFLIGASLDAHELSNKSHGVYQLTETDDINLVIDSYNAYRRSVRDTSGGAVGNGYICNLHR